MSNLCAFPGHLETYGLGIRISFYLLWYSIPLSLWIAPTETKFTRLLHSLLTSATFLGLIIQTDHNDLRPVEIYITLLLCFGSFLYYVPLYIWRLLSCCQIPFDPARYGRVDVGPIAAILNFFLLVAIAFFKLWFWFDVAADSASMRGDGGFKFGQGRCQEYAFFFSRVRLNQKGFVVGHILLMFVILVGCAIVAVLTVMKMARGGWLREVVDDEGRSLSITSSEFDDIIDVGKLRETALQEFDTFIYLLVVSIVLAAIETTISWNGITGVNEVSSPAQTIPLIISVGAVARVVYISAMGDLDVRYRIRRGAGVVTWFGGRSGEK